MAEQTVLPSRVQAPDGRIWEEVLPLPHRVRPALLYVARAMHGRLIPRSRLSDYLEGPAREGAAREVLKCRQTQWPDAEIFETISREEAEGFLASPAAGESHD